MGPKRSGNASDKEKCISRDNSWIFEKLVDSACFVHELSRGLGVVHEITRGLGFVHEISRGLGFVHEISRGLGIVHEISRGLLWLA